MSEWPSLKPRQLVSALERAGWRLEHVNGSHHFFVKSGWPKRTVALHSKEIGPKMVARIAKQMGLLPEDVR
jgi:predicted RNA binding protein YcfA (HicA-like mRNA interferase family)